MPLQRENASSQGESSLCHPPSNNIPLFRDIDRHATHPAFVSEYAFLPFVVREYQIRDQWFRLWSGFPTSG